jgi:hypothetical protein
MEELIFRALAIALVPSFKKFSGEKLRLCAQQSSQPARSSCVREILTSSASAMIKAPSASN